MVLGFNRDAVLFALFGFEAGAGIRRIASTTWFEKVRDRLRVVELVGRAFQDNILDNIVSHVLALRGVRNTLEVRQWQRNAIRVLTRTFF